MRRHQRGSSQREQDALTLARAFDPSRPARPSPLAASTIRGIPLDLVDRMRSFSLFANAPEEFLVAVGSSLRLQVYSPQESILNEGDEAKAMYWLIRGAVMVTSRDRESIYAELPPGSFFGEIGIMMNVPRTASIVARYKSLVARLNKEDLQKELPKYPHVERAIREEAAERLAILERKKTQAQPLTPTEPPGIARKSSKRTHDLVGDDIEIIDGEFEGKPRRDSNKKFKTPSRRASLMENAASSALSSGTVHIRQLLKELPLFAELPDEFLHFLGLNAESRTYPPFFLILEQRSRGRDVFFVVEGMVEVFTDGSSGYESPPSDSAREHIVRARLQSGQYFGEVTSLSLAPERTASVRTVTTVECLVIAGNVIDELWHRCPSDLRSQVEATARQRLRANADFGTFPPPQAPADRRDSDVSMPDVSDSTGEAERLIIQTLASAQLDQDPSSSSVAFKDVSFQGPAKFSSLPPEPFDPDPFFNTDRSGRRPGASRRGSLANVPAEASPLAKDGAQEGSQQGSQDDSQQAESSQTKPSPASPDLMPPPPRPRHISSQASPSGKGFLPDTLLIHTFQYLDFYHLLRFQGVSKHWSRLLHKCPDILHVLNLKKYNRYVTDSVLINIIAPFAANRPRYIDLSNCFHVTDEGFCALVANCGEHVTHWKMKSVWDISPHAIVQMANQSRDVVSVDFSNCRKVSDNLLGRVVGWKVRRPTSPAPNGALAPESTVIGCPKLTRLTLSYCKHVSDRFMQHLAQHAAERLEEMDITRCTTISDAGFRHWSERAFPRLARLVLADCTYLSDSAIACLADAAANLEELDLSFCCALSDAAVDRLSAGLPRLRVLNLAFCGSAVSDASMASIGEGLGQLRDLSVRGCVRVTRTGVEAVLAGCGELRVFDVSQCRNLVMEKAWERGRVKFNVVADGTWRVSR